MGLHAEIFAVYDRFMAATEKAGLARFRESLLRTARGRVLEIGGGTGANLPFYGESITELVITEPEKAMASRLEHKLQGYRIPTKTVSAPAEELPLPSESFDYAASTLVLCTVKDPAQALAEVRRVLKSQGVLLFIEHVRSNDAKLAKWQDRLRRFWRGSGKGASAIEQRSRGSVRQGLALTNCNAGNYPRHRRSYGHSCLEQRSAINSATCNSSPGLAIAPNATNRTRRTVAPRLVRS